MLVVAIFLAALLAFWVYVRWDAKRMRDAPLTPLARGKMEAGFEPGRMSRWPIQLALAAFAALIAFSEWQAPSRPPFTGRGSALKLIAFEALGGSGLLAVYLALTLVFIGVAVWSYLGSRR